MIPWFVVDVVGAVSSSFGFDTYVRAVAGGVGGERIHFVRRAVGSKPLPRLKPASHA